MQVSKADLKITKISEDSKSGVFSIDYLPVGFGNTIGNSLRRALLTAIPGAAITQMKIKGVDHQFSTLSGMQEDVVQFGLNLKQVKFKAHSQNAVVGTINMKGPGVVTAGDIELSSEFEVVNKDLVLATLSDKNANLEAELLIETGVGYSPVESRETSKIGVILLDAIYSPITKAMYSVEASRLGNITGLDKVILTVESDGSIAPSDAVAHAAKILSEFFGVISAWDLSDKKSINEAASIESQTSKKEMSDEVASVSLDELQLPTRTVNALKKRGVETLAQLSEMTDEDLADIKNLGEKSVEEIKKLLEKEGLR